MLILLSLKFFALKSFRDFYSTYIIMSYSTDSEGIDRASSTLIVENAEHLISHIYENQSTPPYNKPATRVGLVIKILIKSNSSYPADLLQPVIDDIQAMLADSKYLSRCHHAEERKNALAKELSLVNKFIEFDDTVSLNTLSDVRVTGML